MPFLFCSNWCWPSTGYNCCNDSKALVIIIFKELIKWNFSAAAAGPISGLLQKAARTVFSIVQALGVFIFALFAPIGAAASKLTGGVTSTTDGKPFQILWLYIHIFIQILIYFEEITWTKREPIFGNSKILSWEYFSSPDSLENFSHFS